MNILENIFMKVFDGIIYVINKVVYKKQEHILERKGKTKLERILRGLIYIPATILFLLMVLVMFVVMGINNLLKKVIGKK